MFSVEKNIYSFFSLCILFSTICIQSLYMIAFEGTFPYAFPAGCIVSFIVVALLLRNLKQCLTLVGGSIALWLIFWAISLPYPDFSYDGPWYHQPIANSLLEGVNVFKASTQSYWADAYPKAIEIFAGEMLAFFPSANGYILINFLLATGLVFYILHFADALRLNAIYAILFAFFATFSYVFVQLAYTHYVDYALYAMMLYSVLSLVLILQKKSTALDYALFIMSNALAISIKMSGGLYPFVAFCLLFVYGLYESKNLLLTVKKCFLLGLPVALLGVLVLGYNPYVTNMMAGKHILHPLAGKQANAILTSQAPKNLQHKTRFEKIFISLTSETYNTIDTTKNTVFKSNPLSISEKEIYALMGTGTRIAGWGPLFLAILIGSLLLPLFFRINIKCLLPFVSFLLLATFIHPESWWARYGFHIYLLPLSIILFLQNRHPKIPHLAVKGFLAILSLLFLCNIITFYVAKISLLSEQEAHYRHIFQQYKLDKLSICMPAYDYKYSFHPKQLFEFYNASMKNINDSACSDKENLKKSTYFNYVQH